MKRINEMTIKEAMNMINNKIAEIESHEKAKMEDFEALETLDEMRRMLGTVENALDEMKEW